MRNTKTRFIHYTFPYAHNSAGLRIVHHFCHLMRKAGYDSYITTEGNPDWDTPIYDGTVTDDDIVIYPEIIKNTNPLSARNVARYMLYMPKLSFGGGVVPANEYFMPFNEEYRVASKDHYMGEIPKENVLNIPSIEPELFKPAAVKDIEAAYWVGKGASNYPSPHLPAGAVQINYQYPATRKELAALLGRTKTFYSFDHMTGLLTEAKMCRCDVLLLEKDKAPVHDSRPDALVINESESIAKVKVAAERMLTFFKLDNANAVKKTEEVDVVMLAWSKNPEIQKMTQEAIDSLHASSSRHKFNVYVMETNREWMSYNGATVIHPKEKFNYNTYINIGVKLCKTRFVVMANNDLVFHPGWFEAIARMNCDSASPITPNWPVHQQFENKIAYGYKAGLTVCGWCIVAKKATLDAIGPLDEKFDFWYQDCDYSVQLSNRRLRHVLVGNSKVTHLGSKSHELFDDEERKKRTIGLHPVFKEKYPKFNEATSRDGSRTTVCLTMIVKNEAKIIEEMLRQVVRFIDYWVVVDTGSTDGTQNVVRNFFFKNNVPGELYERPWVNFGHNRTEAMQLADGKTDYMWVMDADDGIVGVPNFDNLDKDAYAMRIGREFSHWRHQLFRSGLKWCYKGILHEYAHSDLAKAYDRLPGDYYIAARCAGARNSDPEKYKKDAVLLEEAIKTDPNNARYWFYLGQSYFDHQNFKESKRCYEKRVSMGGWPEECFYAQWRVGQCAIALKESDEQIAAHMLKAYEFRPQRAEALHNLAQYYRSKGRNALGYVFGKASAQIPFPHSDSLFIFKNVYDFAALDETAVNAYWMGNFKESLEISRHILEKNLCPPEQVARIAQNMRFAAQKMNIQCPPDELHVLRPGAIGDILMTLWAVEAYARKNPKHKIYYYCAKPYMEIPTISKVVTKVMDATFYPHYAKGLTGYPLKEGYPDKPMTKHLLEYFGAELGLSKDESFVRWEPKFKKVDKRDPYMTIQCKTGWSPYKEWPLIRWQEIVGRIRGKYPRLEIVQIGAPDEPPLQGCTKFNGSIMESITMVAKAKLHIGQDSFPNHVRGLIDRPSVILWGSTSPIGSGYDCNVNIWHVKDYSCSPCYREWPKMSAHPKPYCPKCKSWDDISHPCMHTISVDEVWKEVDKILGGKQS